MPEQQQPLSATLVMDPATRAMIQENTTALAIAKTWSIDDADTADVVSSEANRCKKMIETLEEKCDEFVNPAKQIIEAARKLFSPAIADLKDAVAHYNYLLVDFRAREQRRIAAENAAREEQARKARAEAEARAAAERAKAAEEARQREEQARREAEARQKAENEARAAAAARQKAIDEGNAQAAKEAAERERKAKEEAQRRAAAEAKAQEQARNAVDAGAARAQQMTLEAEAAATATPKAEMRGIAGTQFRTKWVAEMTADNEDEAKKAICSAVASRPELLAYLKLDMTAINRTATAQKSLFNIPGFKSKQETGAAKAKGAN